MKQREVNKILEQHKLWLESEGKEGKRGDLSGASLKNLNFRGANLRYFKFRYADLEGDYFNGADLEGADLRDINSCRTDFTDAVIIDGYRLVKE